MKGELEGDKGLGKPLSWHAKQNRPGHIWLNQLGLDNLQEAILSQRNAFGRLDIVRDKIDIDFSGVMSRQRDLLKELVNTTGQKWIIADIIQDFDD